MRPLQCPYTEDSTMRSMVNVSQIWNDIEPYILQGFLGGIALLGLWKDWRDYGAKIGKWRWPLLILVVCVVALTLYETHHSRHETRVKELTAKASESANKKEIEDLTEQVRGERDDNKHNSDGFRQSFDALYRKYSDLSAKVQNQDLLRELADTKKQLRSAEAKFEQPKAKLTASFWQTHQSLRNLVQETTAQRRPDGSIQLELGVINPGDVPALNGSVTIRICESCKYLRRPEGFVQLPGSDEQDVEFQFDRIVPKAADQKRTIEVIPDPSLNRFEVDMIYSCVNCVMTRVPMFVNVQ